MATERNTIVSAKIPKKLKTGSRENKGKPIVGHPKLPQKRLEKKMERLQELLQEIDIGALTDEQIVRDVRSGREGNTWSLKSKQNWV